MSLMADIKQCNAFGGNSHSPSRQVLHPNSTVITEQSDESLPTSTDTTATERRERRMAPGVPQETRQTETMVASPLLCKTALGDDSSPVREVSTTITSEPEMCHIDTIAPDPTNHLSHRTTVEDIPDEDEPRPIYTITTESTNSPDATGTTQPDVITNLDKSIFTRFTKPNKPERVQKILELVTIGDDLTMSEREAVRDLIVEFADCFALSVSEVKAVKNGEHKLDIKPGTTFSTKVANRPFSPPQKAYFNKVLDELLLAGVTRPIAAEDVKCCSPITIPWKAHSSGGLTINELIHRLEDQCVASGRKPADNLPPRETPSDPSTNSKPTKPKFHFCMNYGELNKSTAV
jgi:hypothetical protein